MNYTMYDKKGRELDFFNEMSKYAGYLRPSHLTRHLAIYELYKKTINLPGSVAEFGVYNGSTYFYLARLIEMFNAPELEHYHAASRHLFGFDTFQGFTSITEKDMTGKDEPAFKKKGGLTGNRETFFDLLECYRKDSSIANRMHIIEGDIVETFPEFLKTNSFARFSFCLMDFDMYVPTKTVLDNLYELMVPGGIIAFDEYGFPLFPGETDAVDEFVSKYDLPLYSIPSTYAPAAYTVIPRKRSKYFAITR
ncbi:MAG: macrocin O-methyltransferase [Desulfuromonadaceae bacterium]|nr:macrocin O-methyltransferase [Desulfuromonadaceae bacterium]MDD5104187.1 macrocin O-methyltransferase [Desulfuromonadaceae bacterium]